MNKLTAAWILSATAVLAAAQSSEIQVTARLLGPISTDSSRQGDRITAEIREPQASAGDILEGRITESKSGRKLKGESVLTFTFETWHHGGQTIPIQSSVTSLFNSRGQENVDEEGRVIRKSNNLGKAALITALGAGIGAAAGGARGAAIGAGAGVAASLLFVKVAVHGPSISFDAGSQFRLAIRERSR